MRGPLQRAGRQLVPRAAAPLPPWQDRGAKVKKDDKGLVGWVLHAVVARDFPCSFVSEFVESHAVASETVGFHINIMVDGDCLPRVLCGLGGVE